MGYPRLIRQAAIDSEGIMSKTFYAASAVLSLTLAMAATAANVAPSRTNPGNFPVEKVPQFVCIGSDDNYHSAGFKFFVDSLKAKKNPTQSPPQAGTFDGTPARMSFFVNSNNGNGYDITGSDA